MKKDAQIQNQSVLKVEKLTQKGVKITNPGSIEIGDEVDIHRISGKGVVIYSGCKIFGRDTLILQGVQLGYEAPVTIDNCQVGPEVELRGGFFQQAAFLSGAKAGSGAHVREGTILEEFASIAHTVALKHTILFPFVTLGSLINFCDCLMAGGTGRKNHSEVGSSYIHFNFTPNQDKATASLIGDVPNGVMLNQKPIFLGGQGGLVGPSRLWYGITVAAGTIVRKDELAPDRLILGERGKGGDIHFIPGQFRNDRRIISNNIIYIANLLALKQWYHQVRSLFVSEAFPDALLLGIQAKIELAIAERLKRLEAVYAKQHDPIPGAHSLQADSLKQDFPERWPELKQYLTFPYKNERETDLKDAFLEKLTEAIRRFGKNYISVIQGLDETVSQLGTQWLQAIVADIAAETKGIIPSLAAGSIPTKSRERLP